MKTLALSIHTNRTVVLTLATLALCSAVFYVYGISKAIHNVAERQSLEKELAVRTAHVSDLEFEYLALKNTVDINMAQSLGFAITDTAHYVTRQTSVAYAPSSQIARNSVR